MNSLALWSVLLLVVLAVSSAYACPEDDAMQDIEVPNEIEPVKGFPWMAFAATAIIAFMILAGVNDFRKRRR